MTDDYTRMLVSALDNDDAGIIRGNASSVLRRIVAL